MKIDFKGKKLILISETKEDSRAILKWLKSNKAVGVIPKNNKSLSYFVIKEVKIII